MDIQQGLPSAEYLLTLPSAISLSLVVSLDGQLCGPDGSSRSISGPEDLEWLRRLRSTSDVIVVGAATAEAEGYGIIRTRPEFADLRAAAKLAEHPELIVLHRDDDLEVVLNQSGPRVQLEAGVRLHVAMASHISRIWISHSPTIVGDLGAAFALPLYDFALVERWCGESYVISRFERSIPH